MPGAAFGDRLARRGMRTVALGIAVVVSVAAAARAEKSRERLASDPSPKFESVHLTQRSYK